MLTNIIVFLVGAHFCEKYPQYATLIVDKAVSFANSLVAKFKELLAKK